MKCLCYIKPDGVAIGHISQTILGAMTGTGFGWDAARIEREIAGFVHPPAPFIGAPEAVIRPFVLAEARGGLTEAQAIELLRQKDQPPGVVQTLVIEKDALPKDVYFHGAWLWSAQFGRVEVDMPKARLMHMGEIRAVRDKELAKLDGPQLAALATGNTIEQARIAAQRQILRDIPQTFDLSSFLTPETLKAAWPVTLPR